jgi:hypothetical protein
VEWILIAAAFFAILLCFVLLAVLLVLVAFDALIRAAVDEYLGDLTLEREQQEAKLDRRV